MIYHHTSPLLKTKCSKTTLEEAKQLLPTFVAAWQLYQNAVGIAAPQIGATIRAFIYDAKRNTRKKRYGNPILIVNPEVLERAENTLETLEGCLSCPGKSIKMKRPSYIKIKYTDETGKERILSENGFAAVVLAHELDHLEGKTIADYAKY